MGLRLRQRKWVYGCVYVWVVLYRRLGHREGTPCRVGVCRWTEGGVRVCGWSSKRTRLLKRLVRRRRVRCNEGVGGHRSRQD